MVMMGYCRLCAVSDGGERKRGGVLVVVSVLLVGKCVCGRRLVMKQKCGIMQ